MSSKLIKLNFNWIFEHLKKRIKNPKLNFEKNLALKTTKNPQMSTETKLKMPRSQKNSKFNVGFFAKSTGNSNQDFDSIKISQLFVDIYPRSYVKVLD